MPAPSEKASEKVSTKTLESTRISQSKKDASEIEKSDLQKVTEEIQSPEDNTQPMTGQIYEEPAPLIDPIYCDPNLIVAAYGNRGMYQWITILLTTWILMFYSANMTVLPFMTMRPIVECRLTKDSNETVTGCNHKVNGTDVVCGQDAGSIILRSKHPPGVTSLLKDFEIECTNDFWVEGGQTAFTMGALTIVPFFSGLADHYGRKKLFIIAIMGSAICNVLCVFAPYFWVFLVLRYLVGSFSDSYYTIGNIYACEFATETQRNYVGLISSITWSCGIFIVGILSKVAHNWRDLYLYSSCGALICITYIFILPESPFWSIRYKKEKLILNYIRSANRVNRRRIDLAKCVDLTKVNSKKQNSESSLRKRAETIFHILKNWNMLKMIGIIGLMTFTMNFFYFAISLEAVDLSEDHFTAFMLSGLVEIPGSVASLILMSYFGRKSLSMISCSFCGILLATAPYLEGVSPWMKVSFILMSKFVSMVGFNVIPIWATEMLPTTVRILAFSIINVPQSIGQIIGPFFRHWNFPYRPTKYIILGVLAVLAGLLGFFLRETKGVTMPEHIRAAETPTPTTTHQTQTPDKSKKSKKSTKTRKSMS